MKRIRYLPVVLLIIMLLSILVSCGDDKQAASDTVIVYITDTGTKYHREGCQYLSKSSKAITLAEAKEKGYEPCSKCNPLK